MTSRSLQSVPVFSGKTEEWSDFRFKLITAMEAAALDGSEVGSQVAEGLVWAEKPGRGVRMTELDPKVHSIARQIYTILAQTCEGEALQRVKANEDKNGFAVWMELRTRYGGITTTALYRRVFSCTWGGYPSFEVAWSLRS